MPDKKILYLDGCQSIPHELAKLHAKTGGAHGLPPEAIVYPSEIEQAKAGNGTGIELDPFSFLNPSERPATCEGAKQPPPHDIED